MVLLNSVNLLEKMSVNKSTRKLMVSLSAVSLQLLIFKIRLLINIVNRKNNYREITNISKIFYIMVPCTT